MVARMKRGTKVKTPKGKIETVAKVVGMRVWTYESQMPFLMHRLTTVGQKRGK
jgi:hypothetical protein